MTESLGPTCGFNEALRETLAESAAFARKNVSGGRIAALDQLGVLLRLAEAHLGVEESRSLLEPTRSLIFELCDLESGVHGTMFRPRQICNRTRRPAAELGFRAWAAVVMQLFHQSGVDLKGSAGAAAMALRSKAGREGITPGQIAKWRESAVAECSEDHLLAGRYQRSIARIRHLTGPAAAQEAKRIARDVRPR